MPPAPLASTLFTPPPSPGNENLSTAPGTPGAAAGQTSFSRLLDQGGKGHPPPPSGGVDEPGTDSPLTLAEAEADSELPGQSSGTDDAPWPPPGLEALIAVAGPSAAPAATGTHASGTDSLLRLPAGSEAATAPALPLPATTTSATAAPPTLPLATEQAGTAAQALALGQHTDGDSLEQALASPQSSASPAPAAVAESASIALLAGLNASTGVNPPPAASTPATLLPGSAELGGEQFDADVAQGVEYMLDNKLQSARIRISPQQLGMIEVELRLEGERVHASFSSAHADVRHALSESLPRLREMLDAQGLQMGQTAVGDSPSGQPRDGQAGAGTPHAGAPGSEPPGHTTATPPPVWRHHRLLDTYA